MKKTINYIYIIFFLLCITIPFILSDKKGGRISEGENRYLATAPDYFENGHLKLGGLREGTEEWINDNAYGREYFLKLTDYINVHMLKEKKSGVNFYGKNDWIFLYNDGVIKNYSHANSLNDDEIKHLVDKYADIQKHYRDNGIGVCTSVFPYKTDIYNEFFTDSIIKSDDKPLIDIFIDNMERNDSFNVDVPYDELMSCKNNGIQAYYASYDASHWNYYGAYIGYLSVMNNVKKDISDLKILSEDDFNISQIQVEKEYAGKTYNDIDFSFAMKEESHASLDMTFFDNINYQSSDTWQSYRYYKNENSTLPKAVMVGDSYVWMFMLPWMSESFSELVFIHQLDIGHLNEMVSVIDADEIIYAGLTDTVYQAIIGTNY